MLKSSIIIDTSGLAMGIYNGIKCLIKEKAIPKIAITLADCGILAHCILMDYLDSNLYRELNVGSIDRLTDRVIHMYTVAAATAELKVTIRDNNVTSDLLLTNTASALISRYLHKDYAPLYGRLKGLEPGYSQWVIEVIEAVVDRANVEDGGENSDCLREATVSIFALEAVKDFIDTLQAHTLIASYDVWSTVQASTYGYLIKHEGDYRIMEWEHEHMQDGQYIEGD